MVCALIVLLLLGVGGVAGQWRPGAWPDAVQCDGETLLLRTKDGEYVGTGRAGTVRLSFDANTKVFIPPPRKEIETEGCWGKSLYHLHWEGRAFFFGRQDTILVGWPDAVLYNNEMLYIHSLEEDGRGAAYVAPDASLVVFKASGGGGKDLAPLREGGKAFSFVEPGASPLVEGWPDALNCGGEVFLRRRRSSPDTMVYMQGGRSLSFNGLGGRGYGSQHACTGKTVGELVGLGMGASFERHTGPENWMAAFQDRELQSMSLPGSHNAAAYRATGDFFVTDARSVIGPSFAKDWALGQERSIYEQLAVGVRSLDLRLVEAVENGENTRRMGVGHGIVELGNLDEFLSDVVRFVKKHPTEVVMLLMRSNAETKTPPRGLLYDTLAPYMEQLAVVVVQGQGQWYAKDLRSLVGSGKQIVFVFDNIGSGNLPRPDPMISGYNEYHYTFNHHDNPNTLDSDKLCEFLRDNSKAPVLSGSNVFHHLNACVTPNRQSISRNSAPDLRSFANNANSKATLPWLQSLASPQGGWVIDTDMANPVIMQEIVKLNHETRSGGSLQC